ncbi:MAG: hypothetical protein IMF01_06455, partial [Proteobacteria bacterium]|nr:hypothetical protein [Pseudomonadota bacterium]
MYFRYVLRGAISFLLAGLLYEAIQPICSIVGVWSVDVIPTAIFGGIGAYALGKYSDDANRVGKFSVVGFALGGVIIYLLDHNTRLPLICGDSMAGLVGGTALGLGWRDKKSALLVGLSAAILMPLSSYINNDLFFSMMGGDVKVVVNGYISAIANIAKVLFLASFHF